MPKPVPETLQKITLRIPESLYQSYERQASLYGRNTEEEIIDRLRRCQTFTDTQSIYIDNTERNELCQLSGRAIRTSSDLLAWARTLTSLGVCHVEVPLDEQLVKRLESRRFGKTWTELMRSMVRENLETAVGLR